MRGLPPSKGLQRAFAGAAVKRAIAEKELLSMEERRPIYENLRGGVCVCGAHKTARQSFCRSHYFALPVGLRRSLYDSDGYAETFLRACEQLQLTPPTTAEKR